MRENKDYLITEKPSRALLIFSIPMIIGNLFQQAYTIVLVHLLLSAITLVDIIMDV